jgi:hypothetical protein
MYAILYFISEDNVLLFFYAQNTTGSSATFHLLHASDPDVNVKWEEFLVCYATARTYAAR